MKKLIYYLSIALLIILLLAVGSKSAIQYTAGLAVAESLIKWNNVKDANIGDNLTSGIMATAPYLYDGVNFDVLKFRSPADALANPADTITTWSLTGLWTGTAWNRALESTHGDNLVTARGQNVAAFNYIFDGTNWDRWTGAISGTVTANQGAPAAQVNRWPVFLSDGTAERGTSANPLRIDPTGTTAQPIIKDTSGSNFYAVKRTDIDSATSVNLAFGFTSKKVVLETPVANTDEVCIDWTGGTAVCPAANTAGDDRIPAGRSIVLDDYAVTSISVISASGTQTVYVRAFK